MTRRKPIFVSMTAAALTVSVATAGFFAATNAYTHPDISARSTTDLRQEAIALTDDSGNLVLQHYRNARQKALCDELTRRFYEEFDRVHGLNTPPLAGAGGLVVSTDTSETRDISETRDGALTPARDADHPRQPE